MVLMDSKSCGIGDLLFKLGQPRGDYQIKTRKMFHP